MTQDLVGASEFMLQRWHLYLYANLAIHHSKRLLKSVFATVYCLFRYIGMLRYTCHYTIVSVHLSAIVETFIHRCLPGPTSCVTIAHEFYAFLKIDSIYQLKS
jgi:hypothetical protein